MRSNSRNLVATLSVGAIALAGLGISANPASAGGAAESATWDIPGTYTWEVPDRVTSVIIETDGASGGDAAGWGDGGEGGLGGSTTATIGVTPGESLQLNVGGSGIDGSGSSGNAGGSNGGGATVDTGCEVGGSGGGASDVRLGGTELTDRVVVAGGGGGAGAAENNGAGGAGGGDTPTEGGSPTVGGLGGQPGTQSAGGAGSTEFTQGNDGSFGVGADNTTDGCLSSGAGGGGWYGGGSGGGYYPEAGGGGGGGSGYVAPGATAIMWGNGVNEGAGSVTLIWTQPPPPTTAPPTTAPPTTAPGPKPTTTNHCPDPAAPVRAFPNRSSLLLAGYLIDSCGYSARGLIAAGAPVTALDPPASSVCPPWVPFRVWPNRPSLTIAGFLVAKCGYRVQWQFTNLRPAPYVVPHGWTPGARVAN